MKIPKIYLTGEINEKSYLEFCLSLDIIEMSNSKLVIIDINSGGGCLVLGLALYDRIKNCELLTHTIGSGTVASSAILPYLAGQKRSLRPNCELLIHYVTVAVDGTIRQVSDAVKQVEKGIKKYKQIVVSETNISNSQIDKLMKHDHYIQANTAIDCKISHFITPKSF